MRIHQPGYELDFFAKLLTVYPKKQYINLHSCIDNVGWVQEVEDCLVITPISFMNKNYKRKILRKVLKYGQPKIIGYFKIQSQFKYVNRFINTYTKDDKFIFFKCNNHFVMVEIF